jgi:enediyne biosynthesis protein E4
MGLDFRDFNNDGYPDLAFVALNNQTFPLFQNTGRGDFREVTTPTGLRDLTMKMSGFGAALYDLTMMAGRTCL